MRRAERLAEAWGETAAVDDSIDIRRDDTPRYYVDGLGTAARESLLTGRRFALDIGDDFADLRVAVGGRLARWPVDAALERVLRRSARVVVHRGVLHAYGLAPKIRESARCVYLPDFRTLEPDLSGVGGGWTGSFELGFVGSSTLRARGALPAGWQLVEWSRQTGLRSRLLVAGSGVAWLRQRSRELGVERQVLISDRFENAREFFAGVGGFYLPQSINRVAHARTTGKLADYVAADVPVFANPVGSALAVLPISMQLDNAALNVHEQVDALAGATASWIAMTPDARRIEMERLHRAAIVIDPEPRLERWRSAVARRLGIERVPG